MSAPAWMPLYVADYLADTGHLSTLEHGAYLLLIMHYWQNEGLPADDARLARICRMSAKEWAVIRDTIAALFEPDWSHKRIDFELEKAAKTISKRSAAGKAGASARYGKEASTAKQSHGKRNAFAMANAQQSNAPIPSPSPKDRSSLRSDSPLPGGDGVQPGFALTAEEPPDPLDIPENLRRYPEEFEELWREYREIGSPNSSKADAHKRWAKLPAGDRQACWTGLVRYAVWLIGERKKRPDYPAKHLATFIAERGWEPFLEDAA